VHKVQSEMRLSYFEVDDDQIQINDVEAINRIELFKIM